MRTDNHKRFPYDSSSLDVPDVICFESMYHINVNHLFATPTQNLIRYTILLELVTTTDRLLAVVMGI